jgi:hypothetical protein
MWRFAIDYRVQFVELVLMRPANGWHTDCTLLTPEITCLVNSKLPISNSQGWPVTQSLLGLGSWKLGVESATFRD